MLLLAALALSAPRPASADILPADSCPLGAKAGERCKNAGPTYDRPGTCVATTCRHPNPLAPGGGIDTPCLICSLPAGSATPGSGAAGDGSPDASDSGAGGGAVPGAGGASADGARASWLVAGLLAAIGSVAALLGRRKR